MPQTKAPNSDVNIEMTTVNPRGNKGKKAKSPSRIELSNCKNRVNAAIITFSIKRRLITFATKSIPLFYHAALTFKGGYYHNVPDRRKINKRLDIGVDRGVDGVGPDIAYRTYHKTVRENAFA